MKDAFRSREYGNQFVVRRGFGLTLSIGNQNSPDHEEQQVPNISY